MREHILSIWFGLLLLMTGPISAQGSGISRYQLEVRKLVVNFDTVLETFHSKRDVFKDLLLDELYRNRIKIDSICLSLSSESGGSQQTENHNIIREYRSKTSSKDDFDIPSYLIQLDLSQTTNYQLIVTIQWIDLIDSKVSDQYRFSIRTTTPQSLLPISSKRIAESIRLNLTKKVRIAIAPFTPERLDSVSQHGEPSRFLSELNNGLRHMLGTSLSQVPWIGIANIEVEADPAYSIVKKQQQLQRQKERLARRYFSETAIESGKLVFPNYILQGNLLIGKDQREMYLDCWLVSLESSLVIAADGIAIADTSLKNLGKSVQGLANRLSRLIELQTALNRPPMEIIGVLPSRTMKVDPHRANRVIEVINALNQKLRQIIDVDKTILLSDNDALEDYLKPQGHPDRINYDELLLRYNVDNILKVDFEEDDRQFFVNMTLESIKDPRKRPLPSENLSGDIFTFNRRVNEILKNLATSPQVKDSIAKQNNKKSVSANAKPLKDDKKNDDDSLENKQALRDDYSKLFLKPDLSFEKRLKSVNIPDAFKNYNLSIFTGLIGRWPSGRDIFLQNGANRMWAISLDIKLPLFYLPLLKELKNYGIGGVGGWDRGSLKKAFELQEEYPNLDLEDIGDIQIDEWFLSLYPVKYYPWRNFEVFVGGGPVVFFVNRGIGLGTDKPDSDSNVVFGGAMFGGFKGLIFNHHRLNAHIDIRGGFMAGKLKKDFESSHPLMKYIEIDRTFPDGTLGGYFIGGGLSVSFRP